MDVEFDGDGNLMVLDEAQGRITVVDPSGNLVEVRRAPGGIEVLPRTFDPGYWAVMVASPDTLWVSRGRDGSSRYLPKPASLRYRDFMAGQGKATNLPNDNVAITYFRSSRLVFLDSTGRVRSMVDGIEPIPFPEVVVEDIDPSAAMRAMGVISVFGVRRVDPNAPWASIKTSSDGSRLFVLFAGLTDNARRVVDTYDLPGGSYGGSYLLPHRVRSAAVLVDGKLATLETTLVPTVRLWRLDESP